MMADSLLVYTIIVLVVGYSQLVVSNCHCEPETCSVNKPGSQLAGSRNCEPETPPNCVNKLGTDSSQPGKSCRDIFENNRASRKKSGYYWIKTDDVYRVYCDMESTCGNKGGWMRIANIDTSQGDDCPTGWKKTTQPPLCKGSGNTAGCYSARFSNNKAKYNSICGKIRGYQKGTTDGFNTQETAIDKPYLDGVSVTIGNPRKHVWSYVAGNSQNNESKRGNCPCAKYPGGKPPVYVQRHYYCESGSNGDGAPVSDTLYQSDPLWDGRGCTDGDHCCSALGPPWFYRYFIKPENAAVEVRLCHDQEYRDEATLIEQLELYVQ